MVSLNAKIALRKLLNNLIYVLVGFVCVVLIVVSLDFYITIYNTVHKINQSELDNTKILKQLEKINNKLERF